jgi:hypothetical protein
LRYSALQSTVAVKHFCTAKLNSISVREIRENPPSAFKQLSSKSSRTGKNRRAGPKMFVFIRVANVGDFSPQKENFGILLKSAQGIFYTNIWTFKVLTRFFLNLGWQHCFHRTGTL